MKHLLLSLSFVSGLFAQPTVSVVSAKNVSWSSAEIQFTSTSYSAYRVRYGTSTCAGGSGGHLQKNGSLEFMRYAQRGYLTGLIPSTHYFACPETFNVSWSSGVEVEFDTLARGTGLPIAPIEMSRVFPAIDGADHTVAGDCSDLQTKIDAAETARAMTGLNQRVIVPAGTICQSEYNTPTASDAYNFAATAVTPSTARLAWTTHGLSEMDEIHFGATSIAFDCTPGTDIYPKGGNLQIHCGLSGGWNLNKRLYAHVVDVNTIQVVDSESNPVYPGWITFTDTAVDFGADTITLTPNELTPAGYASALGTGIAANTEIYLVPLNGATLPAGLSATTRYFILVGGCGSGTATCSFQISESSGGAAKNFTSAGSGTFLITTRGVGSGMWVAKAPSQSGPWILITTDGTLPANGTRITSASDAEMFHLQRPTNDRDSVSFTPGVMAHNVRFKGCIFDADTASDTDYMTMMEPRPFRIGPSYNQTNRYIVLDQCRIQGATAPHRTGYVLGNGLSMEWNGGYIAMINSDMRDLDYPKSWYGNATTGPVSGMNGSRVSNTVARLSAGVAHLINGTNITLGANLDLTVSNGGGVTGVGRVGVDLAGHIQYLLPAGVTATCNTVVFANCDVVNDAGTSPVFPTSSGQRTWLGLGTITFTAGNVPVGGFTAEESVPGAAISGVSEGANSIIAGKGPGPYLFYNNYMGGSGLTTNFDEGGGPQTDRGDYVFRNNDIQVSARARLLQSGSDGLYYGVRQPLEWKSGNRILITGNTFQDCYSQIHAQTFCVVMTGFYYSMTDVEVSNNNFYHTNGGVWYMTSDTPSPVARIARRLRISNNSLRINAWENYAPGTQFPRGFVFQTNAMEDVLIEHNTVFNNRGDLSTFINHNRGPVGGAVIRNNIAFFNGEAPFIRGEDVSSECVGLVNKAFLDCEYIQGAPDAGGADAGYTWEHNVVVPSWTDTNAQSGKVDTATVTAALSGLTSGCGGPCVPDEVSVPLGMESLRLVCDIQATCEATLGADLTLNSGSVYKGQGSDGDIGIQAETLPTSGFSVQLSGSVTKRGSVR